MNDHGVCATSVSSSSIFSQLQQTIFTQFVQGVSQINGSMTCGLGAFGTCPPCVDAVQDWLYLSEYINENPNLTPDLVPTGGFDLDLQVELPIPLQTGPQAALNFSYAWGLNDGILTVTPTQHASSLNNGTDVLKLQYNMVNSLQTAVAQGIYSGAASAQAVDTDPTDKPLLSNCVPNGTPTGGVFPVAIGDTTASAEILRLEVALGNACSDGTFATLGVDCHAKNQYGKTPIDFMTATLEEPSPTDSSVYHNWGCEQLFIQPPTNPSSAGGSCGVPNGPGVPAFRVVYVPRARRLNYYPDSVELVWTDDLINEVGPLAPCRVTGRGARQQATCTTTSAVPLYVVLYDQYLGGFGNGSAFGCNGAFASLTQLCNGTPGGNSRSFGVFSGGHMDGNLVDPVQCVQGQVGSTILNDVLPWNLTSTITDIQGWLSKTLSSIF